MATTAGAAELLATGVGASPPGQQPLAPRPQPLGATLSDGMHRACAGQSLWTLPRQPFLGRGATAPRPLHDHGLRAWRDGTLLKARHHGHLVPLLLDTVFSSAVCTVHWTDSERFQATADFFLKHADRGWSFTDCLSFVVMGNLRLTESLTKDVHFREAGFRPILAD